MPQLYDSQLEALQNTLQLGPRVRQLAGSSRPLVSDSSSDLLYAAGTTTGLLCRRPNCSCYNSRLLPKPRLLVTLTLTLWLSFLPLGPKPKPKPKPKLELKLKPQYRV